MMGGGSGMMHFPSMPPPGMMPPQFHAGFPPAGMPQRSSSHAAAAESAALQALMHLNLGAAGPPAPNLQAMLMEMQVGWVGWGGTAGRPHCGGGRPSGEDAGDNDAGDAAMQVGFMAGPTRKVYFQGVLH